MLDACAIDMEKCTAYRIQIKLGNSKFDKGEPRKSDPTTTWSVIDVVMTTRPLTKKTIAYFRQSGVEVWDKERLWDVWTPQIQAMD